ncbi:hypothetical protein [Nocardiopsis sp. CNT-189]
MREKKENLGEPTASWIARLVLSIMQTGLAIIRFVWWLRDKGGLG